MKAQQRITLVDGYSHNALLEAHLAPRRCMREPIPAIFDAVALLDRAVEAHLCQDREAAGQLLKAADLPAVRGWTESLWGSKQDNPYQWRYHRWREFPDLGKPRNPDARDRMPNKADRDSILQRDGYHCRFCGIPVIPPEVRKALSKEYPEAAYWHSAKNCDQHAALQCLWLQFDHILPHCWGGENTPDNIVITCAPCNLRISRQSCHRLHGKVATHYQGGS